MNNIDILLRDSGDGLYFSITVDTSEGKIIRNTGKLISKAFGLNIKRYNEILVEKVIQHNNYLVSPFGESIFSKDIAFVLRSTPAETYIERFKEVFCKELTTLVLTDVSESEGYL